MTPEDFCCAVTGANGYIGSVIAGHARARGARVVEFKRRAAAYAGAAREVPYTLGAELPPDAFDGVDALIHCAYDFSVASWDDIKRVNVDGTLRLFAQAREAGVRRIVFISTLSAFAGCRSLYGRAKLAVEEAGHQYGVLSVRPGLVFDAHMPRGIVGALAHVMDVSPLVPLLGGRAILYPCHADDLAQLVLYLSMERSECASPVTAAGRPGLAFKQILRRLARTRGKRVALVPVPAAPVLLALRMAERLGVRSRVRSDSLKSLLHQNPHVDFAALDATGIAFRDFSALG